jgi:nicotinamide-nucleotide amidase
MASDKELFDLAESVGHRLLSAGRRLVTAESCTGGWIAKAMTDVAGSSRWFDCGYITYSNSAKVRDLGVADRTLEDFGAVSDATAREMAAGALRVSGADVAVSVSGVAGPDGGTPDKPVGTVWFGVAVRHGDGFEIDASVEHFPGDRESVRRLTVEHALRLILRLDLRTPVQDRS